MKKFIAQLASVLVFTFASINLQAAQLPSNISPQQLEQFKKLAPAQQKSLAQSMGIDLRTIKAQLNKSKATGADQEQQLQQYYPRGTEFDELGNPILSEDLVEEEEEEDDGKPKPFGYDVFANAPMTFAPSMDIAIPDDYVVGSGDTLSIQMFGKENQDYELVVSREGNIMIPELGPFSVSGLTFAEMKKSLSNTIKNKILGVDVVITLSELRSMRVFVLGDAFKPGPYVLSALSSITHALFSAGGINDIGSLRNVQLKRAGKLVSTLDLYDLLIKGDSSNDLILKSGDVIFVAPVGEQVTIAGEVRRPAIYELNKNENFKSVINMAGGLLPSAYPSSTVVERYNQQNLRSLLNIDLSKAEYLSQRVESGDYVRVMKTAEAFEQSITVIGAVSRPGKYQWHQGQKISDLLPNIHAYVSNDADLNYGLVVREKNNSRAIELLQFSLTDIAKNIEDKDNLELKSQDKIIVFSNSEEKNTENLDLNSYALTRDDLLSQEKQKAKVDFENRKFWLEYGDKEQIKKQTELAEESMSAAKSLEFLTGGKVEKKIKPINLNLFSRQRLLVPILEQLQRQAASGEPIQLIEIVGAVKFPGVYPLVVNARIDGAVKAAGGLLESAYLKKVEITRNEFSGESAAKHAIDLNLNLALQKNNSNNIKLQSKDRINILKIPEWQENNIVELRGEFLFPGKYTISRGETLAGLIKRVGGYTDFAYLEGSVLSRVKLKQLEKRNLDQIAEGLRMEIASKSLSQNGSSLDYGQTNLLLADLTKVIPIGRLVIDLPSIKADTEYDVLLENGDILYLPTKQNSINVIGQVQVATSHMYNKNINAEDYIKLSGGTKSRADEERIYIIKANGSIEIPSEGNWFANNDNYILSPGDTVVVPLDSEYTDNLTLWSTGIQIIYQAAVAIAAVSGL
ncbi:MAG: polysaccharide export outer membrane protein [Alteromonadaceae bacterium]|jgi:polysaccharide export outer membrane protein